MSPKQACCRLKKAFISRLASSVCSGTSWNDKLISINIDHLDLEGEQPHADSAIGVGDKRIYEIKWGMPKKNIRTMYFLLSRNQFYKQKRGGENKRLPSNLRNYSSMNYESFGGRHIENQRMMLSENKTPISLKAHITTRNSLFINPKENCYLRSQKLKRE
ncbi:hypothetical protein ACJX0J_032560, partial [Zea mays]